MYKCHYNALQPSVEVAAGAKAYHMAGDTPSEPVQSADRANGPPQVFNSNSQRVDLSMVELVGEAQLK